MTDADADAARSHLTQRLAALLKMDDVADGIMDYLLMIESKSVRIWQLRDVPCTHDQESDVDPSSSFYARTFWSISHSCSECLMLL